MSAGLAAVVVRLRWPVVLAWLALAVACVAFLPTIRQAQTGALGDLVPVDAAAITAEERSAELFAFPAISRTQVVLRDRDGLDPRLAREAVRRVVELNRKQILRLRRIAGAYALANLVGDERFAREQRTTLVLPLLFAPDVGPTERTELAEGLIVRLRPFLGDAYAGVTGAVAAREEQSEVIEDRLPLVELVTVALVLLAVGLTTRSPAAALVDLLAVGLAYVVSIRVVAALGERLGVSVPSEVEPVVVALLFGVVTDYVLFFLARFRTELAVDGDGRGAARRATTALTPVLTACAMAVALGCAALLAAELGFLRAFGPGVAFSVVIALLVAVTFVPACAALLGARLLWPGGGHDPERPSARAEARLRRVVARPRTAVAVALIVLTATASGLAWLEVGNPLVRGLPADAEPRTAYEQARAGIAPGVLSPAVIVIERPDIARDRRALAQLEQVLSDQPGVAAVVGPATNPTDRTLGAVLARTGNAARYVLFLGDDPLGGTAVRRLDNLRQRLDGLVEAVGLDGARTSIAGDTALVAETIAVARDDLPRVLPIVLAAVALVLALLLRALVAPVVLSLLALLAPAGAIGLAVVFFQGVLGHGELTYFVPIAAGVLLVALGSDYNVFLAGRVWEEARHRSLAEAVVVGGAGASRAISAAALVLAASFAAVALVPVRAFGELAFVVAVGLLLDAFLVRSVLVGEAHLAELDARWQARQRETVGQQARQVRRELRLDPARRDPLGSDREVRRLELEVEEGDTAIGDLGGDAAVAEVEDEVVGLDARAARAERQATAVLDAPRAAVVGGPPAGHGEDDPDAAALGAAGRLHGHADGLEGAQRAVVDLEPGLTAGHRLHGRGVDGAGRGAGHRRRRGRGGGVGRRVVVTATGGGQGQGRRGGGEAGARGHRGPPAIACDGHAPGLRPAAPRTTYAVRPLTPWGPRSGPVVDGPQPPVA